MAARVGRASKSTFVSGLVSSLLGSRSLPVVIHTLMIGGVFAINELADDPLATLRLGGYLSAAVHVTLMVIEARRARLGITPLSFYFFWYSMASGAAASFVAKTLIKTRLFSFSTAFLEARDLRDGFLICLVGGLFLHAGIQFVRPMPHEAENPFPPKAPLGRFMISGLGLLFLFAVGLATRTTLLGSVLGGASGILNRSSLVALSAFALLVPRQRRDLPFWALLGFGFFIEFVVTLRSGSKALLMYTFLPFAWLLIVDKRLRRWLLLFGPAMVAFYLGILAPVISTMRTSTADSNESITTRIWETVTEGDYKSQSVSDNIEGLMSRQLEAASVGFIAQEVRHRGFMHGETLDYLAYAFVPRALWPGKPQVTRGAWFNRYLRQERDEHTSLGQIAAGELYWNFGYVGVCLGMSLLGLGFGALWRLSGSAPEREPLAFLCNVTIIFSMNNMPEFGTTVLSLVYFAGFFSLFFWLTRSFGVARSHRRMLRPGLSRAH